MLGLIPLALSVSLVSTTVQDEGVHELVEHHIADSGGVDIHYVSLGEGPVVLMIHGFPDYWYSWRNQMPALAENHQVIAIDQRGYNKSGQPEGVEQYATEFLVDDVAAVLDDVGADEAVIVGHDWGGWVAWSFAMAYPERTERLIVLNLPHPRGLTRELARKEDQHRNSQYARNFQRPNAHRALSPVGLAGWVQDQDAREKYVEAFRRSSLEGMLNYYKANYPREPYDTTVDYPQVECPTLVIHGLNDFYLLAGALDRTWEWIDGPFTLVTLPGIGHFVQHEAADAVTDHMLRWLAPAGD